jgi:hypothetical protein
MIRTPLTALAAAAFVTLVACGADDVGEKYPSTESFCSTLAEEECTAVALNPCSATVDACKTKRTQTCQAGAAAVSGQGRSYSAPGAEACITKTKELLAARNIDPAKATETAQLCERVYTGTKARTQTCATDFECQNGLVCSQGVCFEKTAKNVDEPCGNPGDVCGAGTYCGVKGAAKFCVARPGANGQCSADAPCLESLRCSGGVCLQRYQVNQGCQTSDDCVTGTICSLQNNTKVCLPITLPLGRTCKDDYGGI